MRKADSRLWMSWKIRFVRVAGMELEVGARYLINIRDGETVEADYAGQAYWGFGVMDPRDMYIFDSKGRLYVVVQSDIISEA